MEDKDFWFSWGCAEASERQFSFVAEVGGDPFGDEVFEHVGIIFGGGSDDCKFERVLDFNLAAAVGSNGLFKPFDGVGVAGGDFIYVLWGG